jgi:hypothetical protein
MYDQQRIRVVGDRSQPLGGHPRSAVHIELDQSLGLFGQGRQCGGDGGHARSTKPGVSRVPRPPAQLTQSVIDARGPSIGPSVAEILAAREHGIVLLNPETVHAHKNPLLAAAEVAGCASHPTSV